MNYTKEELHEVLNWLMQNGHREYNKTDVNALIRVNRKFKVLNMPDVGGIFSTADMEKAWNDGADAGEQRGGMFDIENYR